MKYRTVLDTLTVEVSAREVTLIQGKSELRITTAFEVKLINRAISDAQFATLKEQRENQA